MPNVRELIRVNRAWENCVRKEIHYVKAHAETVFQYI